MWLIWSPGGVFKLKTGKKNGLGKNQGRTVRRTAQVIQPETPTSSKTFIVGAAPELIADPCVTCSGLFARCVGRLRSQAACASRAEKSAKAIPLGLVVSTTAHEFIRSSTGDISPRNGLRGTRMCVARLHQRKAAAKVEKGVWP